MFGDAQAFIEYWRNARLRTTRVLDRLPAADLEWTYAPGRFTFGDIFRHLAGLERYMYAENVSGRPSIYPGHARTIAEGPAAVAGYMQSCHAESLAIFETLGNEGLEARCVTPAGASITAWKWLRAMTEHEAHHRGQLYLMASMRGIEIPPLYGLTEEEVARRAAANQPSVP
jgi:uncharacterized damage-inducible protein DinB